MVSGRRLQHPYVWSLFILGFAVFVLFSNVHAGGVHFGFGVDVPIPGSAYPPPPVVAYPAPVVVERTPPPPVVVERVAPAPVVVEAAPPPPPAMIRRSAPVVVYEEPVVIEQRSTVYYYPKTYQYRSNRVETEREYYRTRTWEE
ncbi:MAG: hypothetical protein LLG06_08760 [Desulfobacteraceae bacterium]|nr:hypothetical protein [Desulfobacteraceae bacterium]